MERQRRRLGCLHGHHANIAPLDGLFPADEVDIVHFVDPGLLRRIAADPDFPGDARRARVAAELDWIAACGCDAVVVTCTAYAAAAGDAAGAENVPVVPVDWPLFADLGDRPGPIALVFTNPGTIEPTMARLTAAAGRADHGIEPLLIPDVFDLVMAGRTAAYEERVRDGLRQIVGSGRFATVAAAQLSMIAAARRPQDDRVGDVVTPLEPLAARLAKVLSGAAPSGPLEENGRRR